MPRRGVKKADDLALEGLAEPWERSRSIRQKMLATGRLLSWSEPAKVGVISFDAMQHNYRILMKMLENWLPKTDTLNTFNVYAARREAFILWGMESLYLSCRVCSFLHLSLQIWVLRENSVCPGMR